MASQVLRPMSAKVLPLKKRKGTDLWRLRRKSSVSRRLESVRWNVSQRLWHAAPVFGAPDDDEWPHSATFCAVYLEIGTPAVRKPGGQTSMSAQISGAKRRPKRQKTNPRITIPIRRHDKVSRGSAPPNFPAPRKKSLRPLVQEPILTQAAKFL